MSLVYYNKEENNNKEVSIDNYKNMFIKYEKKNAKFIRSLNADV